MRFRLIKFNIIIIDRGSKLIDSGIGNTKTDINYFLYFFMFFWDFMYLKSQKYDKSQKKVDF